jgi:hypothetical protein
VKHFLAYGNSDQASFREAAIQRCFDIVTVPGTIAAYYPDATAAFVLSSELEYIIDPRTPLFQGVIDSPRASHVALAAYCGEAVGRRVPPGVEGPVEFPPDLYDASAVAAMVRDVIALQRTYPDRVGSLTDKVSRYKRLLAEARGDVFLDTPLEHGRAPAYVLLPYFAMSSPDDEWGEVNRRIWASAVSTGVKCDALSPVVAVTAMRVLGSALDAVPSGLADTIFFWVAGFDERAAPRSDLVLAWRTIEAFSTRGRRLVNLYGGFFSICLGLAGLFGFNNGLGYSESREWPELSATGAAPARYYLPRLHRFTSAVAAQTIVDIEPALRCSCTVCESGRPLISLSYRELKRHFALVRRQELELVANSSAAAVARELRSDAATVEQTLRPKLPRGFLPDTLYLGRWASVLESEG